VEYDPADSGIELVEVLAQDSDQKQEGSAPTERRRPRAV
jgi:hypothetical protein